MGGGGGGDMGFGAECASWLPSMSTMEVSVNGLQYIQLTAAMLKEGSRRMLDSIPDFDITVTAPWTINWDEWTGWLSVFNFDFELLSGYADNLRWMKYLPWSTKQFWLTVGVPLIFGLTTVLLIKSLTAIVWLSMMTASILAIVFAVAAKSMLTDGSAIETAYAAQLWRNSGAIPARFRRNSLTANPSPLRYGEYIDYIIYSGAVGLIICVGTYAVHYVRTLQAVRRLLEREVDTLSEKLALYADGLGDEQKGDLQEAQLHASDMLNVVPENTSLVGGRAESAAEFLQQMKERDNAGMGPKLSWGSFFELDAADLARDLDRLLCWLRYGGILPEILVSVMPFPRRTSRGWRSCSP